MSDNRPIRLAISGAGYFAQFQYEAWTRIEEVTIVACANRSIEKADTAAARYAIPAAFASLEAMLDATRPDLVDIITPPETHLDAIGAAAERGIDVICQKPFCRDIGEARRAVEIAEAADITVAVHENFRFQPWYRKARQIIEDGTLGDLYQIAFRLRPGDGQGPEAYLARQPYFQSMPRFLVHETAIHIVDTFRYLLGEIDSVTASLRRLNPVIAGEDSGIVIFEFAGGQRGLFDGNRLADHAAKNRRLTMGEMLIEGSGGALRLDGDGGLHLRAHGETSEQPVDYPWRDHGFGGDCVFLTQRAIIDARLARAPYETLAVDYLRNIEIEEAIYRSSETASRVVIPLPGRLR